MAENGIASGVVGVGYLGKFHAEKYVASTKAKLVAVADIDAARAASGRRDGSRAQR